MSLGFALILIGFVYGFVVHRGFRKFCVISTIVLTVVFMSRFEYVEYTGHQQVLKYEVKKSACVKIGGSWSSLDDTCQPYIPPALPPESAEQIQRKRVTARMKSIERMNEFSRREYAKDQREIQKEMEDETRLAEAKEFVKKAERDKQLGESLKEMERQQRTDDLWGIKPH